MGILDKKTRFIDLVITQEGKRQIASGQLRAEFASLSDQMAFYDQSETGNVADRIYFEVMERPENAIILEKDDSGRLFPFDFSPTGSIVGNNIFSGSIIDNVLTLKAVTGSQFASTEAQVMSASLKHFKNNYFIGTNDFIGKSDFLIDPNEAVFIIDNESPFGRSPYGEVINVNNAEPFFLDPRLSHLPNFQYLPPINTDGSSYGYYQDIRNTTQETWSDIKERLGYSSFTNTLDKSDNIKNNLYGNLGKESRKLLIDGELPVVYKEKKSLKSIRFLETSIDNNLIMQMFEDSEGSLMTKLDIIDAGIFYDDDKQVSDILPKHVFYVGKVYYDNYDSPTFINIFTIVME
jgi:hypothetical protein